MISKESKEITYRTITEVLEILIEFEILYNHKF